LLEREKSTSDVFEWTNTTAKYYKLAVSQRTAAGTSYPSDVTTFFVDGVTVSIFFSPTRRLTDRSEHLAETFSRSSASVESGEK